MGLATTSGRHKVFQKYGDLLNTKVSMREHIHSPSWEWVASTSGEPDMYGEGGKHHEELQHSAARDLRAAVLHTRPCFT